MAPIAMHALAKPRANEHGRILLQVKERFRGIPLGGFEAI